MNPFNLDTEYDVYLATLIARINKASMLTVNDAVKDLASYLPKSNYFSDCQIILKTLKPLLASPAKNIINKIIYFFAKKLGFESLQILQVEWLYENFEYKDEYAKALIEKHYVFSSTPYKYLQLLSWEDYLKDLQFFKFILLKIPEANKPNSTVILDFDVTKLALDTYLELDVLFDILFTLKTRDPITFKKSVQPNSPPSFITKLFSLVRTIKTCIFINKKYKILTEIFDFVDDAIYEEFQNLNLDLSKKVLMRDIDYVKLRVSNSDQLYMVLNKVSDVEAYLLENTQKSMCVFEMFEKIKKFDSLIKKTPNYFVELVNESMNNHFIAKNCNRGCKKEVYCIEIFYNLLLGKNKIIGASILGKSLDPVHFNLSDIDKTMEYSVNVFPKIFFMENSFKSSAVYVLKKYPEICKDNCFINFIKKYESTTPEQITKVVVDVGSLMRYFEGLSTTIIKRLSQANTNPGLNVLYLFYLRDQMADFTINFADVFEHFLQKNFLIYLLGKKCTTDSFIENTTEYIRNLQLNNTIFYQGHNFDSDPRFYYNLTEVPERDEALLIIFEVLKVSSKNNILLEVLLHLVEIIFFITPVVTPDLHQKLKDNDFLQKIKKIYDFGKNSFVLENFILRTVESFDLDIKIATLEINLNKAKDVIIRNVLVPKRYLLDLNSTYISNPTLEIVIRSIFVNEDEIIKLYNSNRIKELNDSTSEVSDLISKTSELSIGESCNQTLVCFIEKYFKLGKYSSITDFLYLIENDEILLRKNYRAERLEIYIPLLDAIAESFANSFLNLYSITKLESSLDNDSIFEMLFSQLQNHKNSFWLVLFRTIVKSNNLYLCFFIEEMVSKYVKSNSKGNFLVVNEIVPLQSYLNICTSEELCYFSLSFPNLYSKYKAREVPNIEPYLNLISKTKINDGKLSFTKTMDFYKLKLIYKADSIAHTATITIPTNYPQGKPRIEFKKEQKNCKFYYKLNELLNKTSKFIEIFFLWKIDIDNHLIGHTECLICYFIMDPNYKQLPNFECKTCKNIFHDRCVYKWAGQSKKNLCPFCRSDLELWKAS